MASYMVLVGYTERKNKTVNVEKSRDLLAEKLNLGKDWLVITRHSCASAIKSRQLKLQTEKAGADARPLLTL